MNKTPVDQRLARLQSLYVAALKVSPDDRDRWLTQHHESDDTIVDEVRSLLRYVQRSTDPLEDGVQLSQSIGALLKRAQSRQPGEFIGKFAIKKLLGIGGFGAVYLCFDSLLKRDVAVKISHAGYADSADRFEKQLIEAQRVAALDCPGIIPIYEGGYTAEGIPYFAMKYIPGQTLYDRIRSSQPTAGESAAILARVAETLSLVHAHGIVHRDLKPTNIILDEQDSPFIADFGLAELATEINQEQGGLAGTPSYMAPEQFDATNQ